MPGFGGSFPNIYRTDNSKILPSLPENGITDTFCNSVSEELNRDIRIKLMNIPKNLTFESMNIFCGES